MKINSISPDRPIFIGNTQVQQSEVQADEAEILPQPKTQVLLDNQVKLLLGELTKLLEQQTAGLNNLPPAIGQEAEKLLQQPLIGEEVIPGGLTALYRGQKVIVQNLTAFAGTLEDAAVLSQGLPRGLPAALNAALTVFQDQAAKLGANLDKSILLLAQKLVDNPNPIIEPSVLLTQAARSLLDSMPREELTLARQEIAAKLPGLLNSLGDDFAQELSRLATEQGKDILVKILRDSGTQLLKSQAKAERPFIGLPSLLDDLIGLFENELNNVKPQLAKDVLLGNLRQLCRQSLQELAAKDEQNFKQLANRLQERIPDAVKLAAAQHGMPELNQAWILQRIVAGRRWLNSSAEVLQQAAQNLREMAAAIQRTADLPAEAIKGHNSVNLLIPLYLGEEKKAYPAYIHVYQEKERRSGPARNVVPETWLRLCLATENIGIVDMVFHIFGQNQLSIRVNFSDIIIAEKFKDNLDEIRSKLGDTPLTLNDFNVNTA